jgi:hypothetical protein
MGWVHVGLQGNARYTGDAIFTDAKPTHVDFSLRAGGYMEALLW